MVFSQSQTFFALLLIGAVVGAYRGWHREVIACAVILATVLFLVNGGGTLLSNLLVQGYSNVSQPTNGATGSSGLGTCTAVLPGLLSKGTFVTMTWLGYRAGKYHAPAPEAARHRATGILPGVVNGAAVGYYLSNYVFPGTQFVIGTPTPANASAYLPQAIGLGILALLVTLFIAGQARKSKKGA